MNFKSFELRLIFTGEVVTGFAVHANADAVSIRLSGRRSQEYPGT